MDHTKSSRSKDVSINTPFAGLGEIFKAEAEARQVAAEDSKKEIRQAACKARIAEIQNAQEGVVDPAQLRSWREELVAMNKREVGKETAKEAENLRKILDAKMLAIPATRQPEPEPQSLPEPVVEVRDPVAEEILAFKNKVSRRWKQNAAILDQVKDHLEKGRAGKTDLQRLDRLDEQTRNFLGSRSAAMLARESEYASAMAAVEEIEAGIASLRQQLEAAKQAYIASVTTTEPAEAAPVERVSRSPRAAELDIDAMSLHEIGSRLNSLERLIGRKAAALTNNDTLWRPQVPEEVRRDMIFSIVVTQTHSREEIARHLSTKGGELFFREAEKLREWSEEMNALMARQKFLEGVADVERPLTHGQNKTNAKDSLPQAESFALARLHDAADASRKHDAERARDLQAAAAQIAAEVAEVEPQEARAASETGVAAVAEARQNFSDKDRARRLVFGQEALPPTHAAELLKKYGTPKARKSVETPQASASPEAQQTTAAAVENKDVRGDIQELFDHIQSLFANESLDAEELTTAVNEAAGSLEQLLNAEGKRMSRVRETDSSRKSLNKDRKWLENSQKMRRAIPKMLKEAVAARQTEQAEEPSAEQKLNDRLAGVAADLRHGRQVLDTTKLRPTVMWELMGAIETKLSQLYADIETAKMAGRNVAILEGSANNLQRDLRRLQDNAKDRIAQLSMGEAHPDTFETSAGGELETHDTNEPEPGESPEDSATVVGPQPRVFEPATINPSADFASRPAVASSSQSFFGRARATLGNALSYVRNGWHQFGESQLRAVVEAEQTPKREMSKTETAATLLKGVMNAGLQGVMSYSGVAVVPDAVRYFSQKSYTKAERAKIEASVREVMFFPEQEADADTRELLKRQEKLSAQIEALPYSDKRKQALRDRLEAIMAHRGTDSSQVDEVYARQVAKALEAHITTTISGAKVTKEAVNTGLRAGTYMVGGPLVLAGLSLTRGASYSMASLYERWSNAQAEVARGERFQTSLRDAIAEGFNRWRSDISFQGDDGIGRKSLNFMRASGQLGRAAGMAVATLHGLEASGVIDELLARYEHFSSVHALPPAEVPVAPGVETHTFAAALHPKISVPETPPEPTTFHGEIPVGSHVEQALLDAKTHLGAGEGITFPLRRVIEANPEAYGYHPESSGLSPSMFAKLKAVEIANRDQQMQLWLTKDAVGRLNLFPEMRDGEWHVAAVLDGKKVTIEELALRGLAKQDPTANK